ncbi:MAG TPA: hypothetical protein VD863_13680 [Bradyrhizobium sp.]|jgi:hypothetical protein|nr:hypothetical protein [Bradyrhizobium sp.]
MATIPRHYRHIDVTDTDVVRPDRNTTSMSLAHAVALLIEQNADLTL